MLFYACLVYAGVCGAYFVVSTARLLYATYRLEVLSLPTNRSVKDAAERIKRTSETEKLWPDVYTGFLLCIVCIVLASVAATLALE